MTTPKFPYWRLNSKGLDDKDKQNRIREVYDMAKAYRSEVIDASTLIELQLNKVLCDGFIGCQAGLQNQFESLILSAEFCSFFQKWRLLRSLINNKTVWWEACKPDNHDKQVNKLKNLISHRNSFAHGEIIVDSITLTSSLHYFEGGKKSVELNNSYVQVILNDAEELLHWLSEMEIKYDRVRNTL